MFNTPLTAEEMDAIKEMDVISWAIEIASKYGLQAEVVHTAFQYKTLNPDSSIEECFAVGLDEWDL